MKKIVSLIIAAVLLLVLASCGSNPKPVNDSPAQNGADQSQNTSGNSVQSSGEEMVITVTNVLFDDSPENVALAQFKEEIEEQSGGRMKVEIYANGIMGGEMDNVENVRSNNVTMTMASTSVLANFVPQCEIFDLPYAFPTVEIGTKVLQDPDVRTVLDDAFSSAGFHFVGANTADFRWLTTRAQVNSVADLAGMKVRVMENQNHVALWSALGANPTPMAGGGQLFTSLQQKTVDAQENPVAQINNGKYYEVQDYVVDTRHIMNVSGWIVNSGWYEGLSDGDRAIFDTAADNFINYACQLGADRVADDLAACEAGGMTHIPLSDEVRSEFKAAIGDTVEKMIRSDIGDELVDAIQAAALKYQ